MTISLPLLLVFAILLGAWLTWLAVRRADRRRLVWRLLASWVAVACLALLVSPHSINRTYSASEAILLTEGYSQDTLQSLLTSLKPRPQVFYSGVAAKEGIAITDFDTFKQQHPTVQTLHVVGNGLTEEDLLALSSVRLVPHLSPLPAGVLSASWPEKITLGNDLQVQGKFTSAEKAVTLYLSAAGAKRDSVEIKKGTKQAFSLRFKPKTSGQFVYYLQWKENDSTYQEAVPFVIEEPRLLKVLLLSSSPSFEIKFLKNALAEQGHGVAVRNQMSKGIYQTETVNLPAVAVNRITTSLLQKFDVVLLDEATLPTLSAGEKQTLQQAVRQQGLGVLTSFSGNRPKPIPFFAEAVFKQISEKQAITGPVHWAGQISTSVVLPLTSFNLQPREGQQTLVWGNSPAQTLVSVSRKGMGRVGVSLVPETFPLALEGKEKLYQEFWATVLTALAQPEEEPAFFVEPNFATVHQPSVLSVSGESLLPTATITSGQAGPSTSALVAGSSLLPMQQAFTIWPQEQGWHFFQSGPRPSASFYTYPATSWQTYRLHKQQQVNLLAASAKKLTFTTSNISQKEAFPLWPFGLTLLLALGFLWLEEKV